MPKNQLSYMDITKKPVPPKTLVCVTDQMNCDRIIKAARVICDLTASELSVINVSSPGRTQDPRSIEYLFKVSAQYHAQMTVLYHNDPAKAVIGYIKSHKIASVVTGQPEGQNSVLHKIWSKFTHVNFFTVDPSGEISEVVNPVIAARAIAPVNQADGAVSY